MATPKGVMQTFMRMLMNSTSSSGKEALDNAVRECSNGKYYTMDAALDSFISEVLTYKNSTEKEQKKFLADRCGIIMDNEDTGALIGADASGGAVKTKISIVDEGGDLSIGSYPYSGSSYIHGITFKWPDSSTLTAKQQNILSRMNTIWLDKAMELVENSYGVSFTECSVQTVDVKLEWSNNDALAWAGYTYYNNGKTSALSLTVNLRYFENVDLSDENGRPDNSQTYLDRVLAHELTHTFMQATIPYAAKIPSYVMEGMAELTHGIDDERYYTIYNVFNQSSDWLHECLNVDGRFNSIPSEGYAAGYMFFRYLMKQAATYGVPEVGDLLPDKFIYLNNKTTLKVQANSTDYNDIDLSAYASTVKTLDLSEDTNYRSNIRGTGRSETIYLSQNGGNVYAGSGDDVIYCNTNGYSWDYLHFGNNDGNNIVYNFSYGSSTDYLYIDSGELSSYWYSGNDRILRIGNTKVTLKNSADKMLYYYDAAGVFNSIYANTNNGYDGYISYSNDGSIVYVADGFQGTINLNDYPYSSQMIFTVDASAVTGDFSVEGNYRNNTIKLGSGYNTVRYGVGSGRDVVYNFNPSKSNLEITNGTLQKVGTAGNDVYLRYSNGEDVIQLVGVVNKSFNLDGQRTMVMAQDKANTVTYADGVTYYGSKTKQDTLKVMNGERIHLYDANFHDIDVLNAQSSNKRVAMAGSNGTSTLYGSTYDDDLAGSNGNTTFYGGGSADRIWCGAGVDTIMVSVGSNSDVVYGFDVNKDRIQSVNATLQKVGTAGNDVYLRYSTGNDVLQIRGIVNKSFLLDGKRTMVMAQDRANTVTYTAGVTYYGSKTKQDTLKVMNGERIHLYDSNFHDIDVLNAQSSKKRVAMAGSNGTSTLYGSAYDDDLAGSNGNTTFYGGSSADRIWCGNGVDTIMFSVGSGCDVVNGFNTAKDKVKLVNAKIQKVGIAGSDVYLRCSSNDVLQIKGIAGKTFNLDGKNTMVLQQDRENTVKYSAGMAYYGAKTKLDTLQVTNGERLHLYDSEINDIDVLDGRQSTKAVKLGGGSEIGTLYGSKYADDFAGTSTGITHILGGKGNDRVWGNNGSEVIYFGTGDGQDTVYSGGATDKLVFYNISDISKLQMSKSGKNVSVGIKGTSDKVVLDDWDNHHLRSIQLSNGAQYQLMDDMSLMRFGISYMTQVQALGDSTQEKVASLTSPLAGLVTELKPLTPVSKPDKKRLGM
ncbi:MAG: calcium-binding protein [Selenomonas ruminantium]|uniref:Calcium-binding protein n=1 Tax=Selenomonas ruminantium TaxID=971 RepID=A0A927WGX9_SELRU|nr:calcium-binding protein [Selenomonas ruminantium]